MLNKINLSLYKSLLYCDLFFMKQSFYRLVNTKNLFLLRFKGYRVFNLLELLKNFKRFFLVVKFVFGKEANRMILNFNQSYNYQLANFFFTMYPVNSLGQKVVMMDSFQILKPKSGLESDAKSFFYCLMGQSSKVLVKQAQKLGESDILLTSLLTLQEKILDKGLYNIQVDFNDFKKLMFLLLFLQTLIKKYT